MQRIRFFRLWFVFLVTVALLLGIARCDSANDDDSDDGGESDDNSSSDRGPLDRCIDFVRECTGESAAYAYGICYWLERYDDKYDYDADTADCMDEAVAHYLACLEREVDCDEWERDDFAPCKEWHRGRFEQCLPDDDYYPGDDDDGDDDADDCDDNTAPVLNEVFYSLDGEVAPVDGNGFDVPITSDEFAILFDYEDADCNLDGGVMLVDFYDGAGFQEGPSIQDVGCSTAESGIFVGYLLNLVDGEGAPIFPFDTEQTTTNKWQDVCGAESNVLDVTFTCRDE